METLASFQSGSLIFSKPTKATGTVSDEVREMSYCIDPKKDGMSLQSNVSESDFQRVFQGDNEWRGSKSIKEKKISSLPNCNWGQK